jgi:hypothetical protein
VKVSVNWGADEQFATICQNSTETPLELVCFKPKRGFFGAWATD